MQVQLIAEEFLLTYNLPYSSYTSVTGFISREPLMKLEWRGWVHRKCKCRTFCSSWIFYTTLRAHWVEHWVLFVLITLKCTEYGLLTFRRYISSTSETISPFWMEPYAPFLHGSVNGCVQGTKLRMFYKLLILGHMHEAFSCPTLDWQHTKTFQKSSSERDFKRMLKKEYERGVVGIAMESRSKKHVFLNVLQKC